MPADSSLPASACSRRQFLRRLSAGAAGAFAAGWAPSLLARPSLPALDLTLGHLVLTPSPATAAQAVVAGAQMGADEAGYNVEMFGGSLSTRRAQVDTAAQVETAARGLLDEGAQLLVAHVDDEEALQAVAEQAASRDVLVWNTGARSPALRTDACHRHLVHVEASDAMYVDALASWMRRQEGLDRVAFLTGEAPPNQRLRDLSRDRLSAQGIEVRDDLSLEALSAESLAAYVQDTQADVLWLNAIGDAQIEACRLLTGSSVPVFGPHWSVHHHEAAGLPPMGTWPVLWHPSLFKYGASQVSDRFAEQHGRPMHSLAYANWAAVSFAVDLAQTAGTPGATPILNSLRGDGKFDGRKGAPLTLRPWNHQLRHELYVVSADFPEEEGDKWAVAASVPDRIPDDPDARLRALDGLGISAPDSSCSL